MHHTLHTPDGPFTVVVSETAVLASGWTDDVDTLVALIHPTLRATATDTPPASAMAGDAIGAVGAYYDGDHLAPSRIPVRQHSGPYRMHAWDTLRGVTPGEQLTYARYAARTGRPAAVRAAAGACAMNAAALFVPCHRVLRTDGTLGGFRYGLDIKSRLLARETTAAAAEVG